MRRVNRRRTENAAKEKKRQTWNWTTTQQNKTTEEHLINLSQDKNTLRLR
jgi:hypothetical protein